ncbi:hypothetical protein HYS96_03025 [Candidatus Daviesbacteria bacterium]|nr:hypothetical protein [Candidatus Daviesbacteria bacterium]
MMKKEDILKFYSKYRLFVFPAVVALSSLLLIVWVILPQTIKLLTNQATRNDLLHKSQFLEVKAQTLETLDQGDLSKKVEYALNAYPSGKDFGNVLGIIQRITTHTGFSIVSFNVGGSKGSGDQNYSISLQLIGSRQLISTLLNSLEKAPRLMKVDSIEVSQATGIQGAEVNLGLSVLFSPLPQNFGTVDSPLPELSQNEEELLVRLAGAQEGVGITRGEGEIPLTTPRGKANPFE